jgi:UDP-glucose 4-epimerase
VAKKRVVTKPNILVTGACGGLASELSRALNDHYNLVGIDPRRERLDVKFFGELHRSNYRSRKVDEVFRKYKFSAFFHLGRVPVTSSVGRTERYSENVLGTRHLLELAQTHEIPTVVVMSTFHVYGAHPHNPLYLKESDPLRATQRILELSDALELDHLASQFALTFKGNTVILRPTNVVGKKISNTLTNLLRLAWFPAPLGFDPSMQVLHEEDLVNALVEILRKPHKGIFNIAGPGTVPLSKILELKHIKKLPVPDFIIRGLLNNLPSRHLNIPSYMVDFLKFPTLIDTSEFSRVYKFEYKHGLIASLEKL